MAVRHCPRPIDELVLRATASVLEGGDHSFVGGDPEDEAVETTVARLTGRR